MSQTPAYAVAMRAYFLGSGLGCAVAALLAAVTACEGSSFSSALAGDSSAPAGDSAPASDSAPAGDAADGGTTADGSWCATHPETFCEDFDEQTDVTAFLASWTTYQQTNGMFAFDTDSGVPSPPNALRVTGKSSANVLVVKTLPRLSKRPQSFAMAFDLRVNSTGASFLSPAGFAAIAYGEDVNDGYVALAITGASSLSAIWSVAGTDAGAQSDAGTLQAQNASGFPTPMTWSGRYAIQVTLPSLSSGTTGACLQVSQGTKPLLSPCMPLPPSLSSPSVLSLVLGDLAGGLELTGNVDIEFDDVTFAVTY